MACACTGGPSIPSTSASGGALAVTCSAPTIPAGDYDICAATVNSAIVTSTWASSDPTVAVSLGFGVFIGKQEGQVTLKATYAGQSVTAPLAVHLEDVIRATAAAGTVVVKVGSSATLTLQGFYGVASSDSGTLTLVITDQTGTTIATSTPLTVPHGGDTYIISSTFRVPPGTTRVCKTGVLQIGPTTLTVVPVDALLPCVPVTP